MSLTPTQIAEAAHEANELPDRRDTAARLAYRQREYQIRDAFAANLAAEYLPAMPTTVTDKVFDKAWSDAHSSGLQPVEDLYADLADIVDAVVAAARG